MSGFHEERVATLSGTGHLCRGWVSEQGVVEVLPGRENVKERNKK